MRRRTSVDGDFASRNRRTASRSWSCSSEKAKSTMLRALLIGVMPAVILRGARYLCRRVPIHTRTTLGDVPRPAHYETTDVRIDKINVGLFENNVFVVRCRS